MKRAEFSTLSFTNSLEVNYFCQIAVVVSTTGWRDTRHDFLSGFIQYHREGLISVIVFSPATSPAPEICQGAIYVRLSTILRGSSRTIWRGEKVLEQEFQRPHHNHLTSINYEINRRDDGNVLIP
jgi:hypothetical protein